ncbi:MAG: hypothetical protein BWY21_00086 [Parcubacteria group bacterium ADurb.Bin216]|nr:MAG: hypothetical protein BWY21_00086 [Parcubacteria group bacterium ADurb.Bin216]
MQPFCIGESMFGFLEDVAKAAIATVKLPISLVADVVTMGGALTDKDEPYTVENVSDIVKNLDNATKPMRQPSKN